MQADSSTDLGRAGPWGLKGQKQHRGWALGPSGRTWGRVTLHVDSRVVKGSPLPQSSCPQMASDET